MIISLRNPLIHLTIQIPILIRTNPILKMNHMIQFSQIINLNFHHQEPLPLTKMEKRKIQKIKFRSSNWQKNQKNDEKKKRKGQKLIKL